MLLIRVARAVILEGQTGWCLVVLTDVNSLNSFSTNPFSQGFSPQETKDVRRVSREPCLNPSPSQGFSPQTTETRDKRCHRIISVQQEDK